MPNFYIPLSGLDADSTALNTIANNLSNMNTTGFKAQTTNFSDLFYQEVGANGSGDAIQEGTGVQVASNSTDFTGGSISATGISTDAAIDGSGLFVLDNNGTQLYSRAGDFQTSSTGTLETSGGNAVMGYAATNGVIDTSGSLTDLAVPTGQVMQPSATTTFGMTQNLDSATAIGTQATGNVTVYDSLGKSYDATVTYTNLGSNKWSYAVTLPDSLAAAPATAAKAATLSVNSTLPAATSVPMTTTPVVPPATVINPVSPAAVVSAAASTSNLFATLTTGSPSISKDTLKYSFAPTGVVNTGTSLTISDGTTPITVSPSSAGETIQNFATQINADLLANGSTATATYTNGNTLTNTAGTLSIIGPTGTTTVTGTLDQSVAQTTNSYTVGSYTNPTTGAGALATVDPSTTLSIKLGSLAAVSAPAFTSSMSVGAYATALQSAIGQPSLSGVTVSANTTTGKLSITGPSNMSVSGFLNQNILGTTVTSSVLPDAASSTTAVSSTLSPVGGGATSNTATLSQGSATTATVTDNVLTPQPGQPAGTTIYNLVTSGGAPAQVGIATSLTVTPTAPAGPLITLPVPGAAESLSAYATACMAMGPSTLLNAGVSVTAVGNQLTITGATTAGSLTQDFTGASTAIGFAPTGTVDPASGLTITGPTAAGGTNTTALPSFSAGETVQNYGIALQSALTNAGIVGVTVIGTNGVSGTPSTPAVAGSLSITGPTGVVINNSVEQDVALTTTNYNLTSSNGAVATVDPSTTLSIREANGTVVTAPTFTSSQSVSAYAKTLQTALTAAGVTDVTVSGNSTTGQLSIVGPANALVSGSVVQDFAATTTNYNFGTYTDPNTGLSQASLVGSSTSLMITGTRADGTSVTTPAITPINPAGETLTNYATDVTAALTTAGITGVTVTADTATGQLSIVGPSSLIFSGNVSENMLGTTDNYAFETNATVDPTTNLTISGDTASGALATITAPTVSSGETVAEYATALTSALSAADIAGVTVSATNGQLSIVGANMSLTGSVKQGLADSTINYDFGSSATVNPSTNITITGPTVSGNPATAVTTAPTVTAGETVAQYAAALNLALTSAGINTGTDGVSVTSLGGKLSITGPADMLHTAGTANQDLTASTINYDFGTSGSQIATVNAGSNLTITGQTSDGSTATTAAPTLTPGTTLSEYVNDLNNALTASGIAGVTVSSTAAGVLSITGANVSTSGSLIQDPVVSAAGSGTLTFNANGNLVSPAADVSGISFAGLSDGAATMNLNWGLFGANGTADISQTATTSTTSATNQNGYASGQYESFTINSAGVVTASYSNSQSQIVGQVAIATVSNEQGLEDVGSTEYQTTSASGNAAIGVAGAGGRGTIEGSSLEASNVNISDEFSDLIIAQRAFEANSKAVTTFDTITQETINMIH